jgi:hypothetical protein
VLTQLGERLACVVFERRQDPVVNLIHIGSHCSAFQPGEEQSFYGIGLLESNRPAAIIAVVAEMTSVTLILVPLPVKVA